MSTRRKQQREAKRLNPPTALPQVGGTLQAEDLPCPGCRAADASDEVVQELAETHEVGPCGTCNTVFGSCYGTTYDQDDVEVLVHPPLSWNAAGQQREGDRCPTCT